MKPTEFSHETTTRVRENYRATEEDENEMITWKFVENLQQLRTNRVDLRDNRGIIKNMTSTGVVGRRTIDKIHSTECDEMFEDESKRKSESEWNSSLLLQPSRPVPRSRSLIRTNPWVSPTGESPPRSPIDGQVCRCWSLTETGPASPRTEVRTLVKSTGYHDSTSYADSKYSTMKSLSSVRRQDSMLTSSMESESVCQSMTSDTDTATSLMSVSDVGFHSMNTDEQLSDVGVFMESQTSIRSALVSNSDETICEGDEYIGSVFDKGNCENFSVSSEDGLSPVNFEAELFWAFKNENNDRPNRTNWIHSTSTNKHSNSKTIRPSKLCHQCSSDALNKSKHPWNSNTKYPIDINQEIIRNDSKEVESRYNTDGLSFSSLQSRCKVQTVRSSLQEKVSILSRQKRMVDEKIREAKEEEKIRLLQLELFRQTMNMSRKEMLLRTLDELKRNLHEQSLKLQRLYDIVLGETQHHLLLCRH